MNGDTDLPTLHHRLVETLYCDTMLLADEARAYAEHRAPAEARLLDTATGVVFACESLRLTTRLMYVLAWLLNCRAVLAGELAGDEPSCRLGLVAETEASVALRLPDQARSLIVASEALYHRAAIHDAALVAANPPVSPARALQQRLAIDLRS